MITPQAEAIKAKLFQNKDLNYHLQSHTLFSTFMVVE